MSLSTKDRVPAPVPPGRPPASAADWLAMLLATWFGCGLAPLAPGTVGTLGALPLYALVVLATPAPARWPVLVALTLLVSLLGLWAGHREARRLGSEDPPSVVIDEAAGVLLALCFLEASLLAVTLATLTFRVLDIAKPWPIRRFEHVKPVGVGIMLDDLAAGLAAGLLSRWLLIWISQGPV